jgi:hypothetical protein
VINNLTAGTTYDVSGWVNLPQPVGSSLSLKPKVEWRNGSTLIYRDTLEEYEGVTNGWDQFSGSLVAPAGTTNARLVLAATGLNGTIYLDDFVFRPQSTTLLAPANTTTGSALNNSQIVAETTAVSDDPNQTTPASSPVQKLVDGITQLWSRFTATFGIVRN